MRHTRRLMGSCGLFSRTTHKLWSTLQQQPRPRRGAHMRER
jgi:hypothetical protein